MILDVISDAQIVKLNKKKNRLFFLHNYFLKKDNE